MCPHGADPPRLLAAGDKDGAGARSDVAAMHLSSITWVHRIIAAHGWARVCACWGTGRESEQLRTVCAARSWARGRGRPANTPPSESASIAMKMYACRHSIRQVQ